MSRLLQLPSLVSLVELAACKVVQLPLALILYPILSYIVVCIWDILYSTLLYHAASLCLPFALRRASTRRPPGVDILQHKTTSITKVHITLTIRDAYEKVVTLHVCTSSTEFGESGRPHQLSLVSLQICCHTTLLAALCTCTAPATAAMDPHRCKNPCLCFLRRRLGW